jgi:hypothetical protein
LWSSKNARFLGRLTSDEGFLRVFIMEIEEFMRILQNYYRRIIRASGKFFKLSTTASSSSTRMKDGIIRVLQETFLNSILLTISSLITSSKNVKVKSYSTFHFNLTSLC